MAKFNVSEMKKLQEAAERAIDTQMTCQMQRQQELLDLLTKNTSSRAQNASKKSQEDVPEQQTEPNRGDLQGKDTQEGFLIEQVKELYPDLTSEEIKDMALGLLG